MVRLFFVLLGFLLVPTSCSLSGSSSEAKAKKGPADNSFCLVCHADFEEEELASVHQEVGVGCEACHGPSYDHSSDEGHLTPPDRMFPKEEINPYCMKCHGEADLAEEESHGELLKAPPGGPPCTQCHGEHRIRNRIRKWDKKTGKLLWAEGG